MNSPSRGEDDPATASGAVDPAAGGARDSPVSGVVDRDDAPSGDAPRGLKGVVGLPVRAASDAVRWAEGLPVAGRFVRATRDAVSDVSTVLTTAAADALRGVVTVVVREVVDILVTEVDLTDLVVDNVDIGRVVDSVDLDAVIADVDVDRILDRVDLDAVVARVDLMAAVQRVDLNEVVAGVDLDTAVGRVDLEAILRRLDMIALANEIIDGVNLTDIIRDASSSVTADVMTDVRSTGERADDAVANAIGRILRRKSPQAQGPAAAINGVELPASNSTSGSSDG